MKPANLKQKHIQSRWSNLISLPYQKCDYAYICHTPDKRQSTCPKTIPVQFHTPRNIATKTDNMSNKKQIQFNCIEQTLS